MCLHLHPDAFCPQRMQARLYFTTKYYLQSIKSYIGVELCFMPKCYFAQVLKSEASRGETFYPYVKPRLDRGLLIASYTNIASPCAYDGCSGCCDTLPVSGNGSTSDIPSESPLRDRLGLAIPARLRLA